MPFRIKNIQEAAFYFFTGAKERLHALSTPTINLEIPAPEPTSTWRSSTGVPRTTKKDKAPLSLINGNENEKLSLIAFNNVQALNPSFQNIGINISANGMHGLTLIHENTLNIFSNEIDAARAFNNAAVQHHGEFAVLNPLPDDDTNTDSQDNDNPELTASTSEFEEFTAESGDVEEEVD